MGHASARGGDDYGAEPEDGPAFNLETIWQGHPKLDARTAKQKSAMRIYWERAGGTGGE